MFDTIKTVYICGPITSSNEPDNNRAAFKQAETELEISYNVLNPWRNYGGGRPDAQVPPQAVYMRLSFHQLLNAHAIYLLEGWECSDNCQAELAVAKCLNLEIIHQS
jgi:hypothetical protein